MRFLFKLITKPIGCLFSLLFSLLILVVVGVVAGVMVVDHYAGDIANSYLYTKTGFSLTYAKQDVNLFKGLVDFQGLKIANSNEFKVPDFVDMNEIKVQVPLGELSIKKFVADEMVVDLKNLAVVRTADGQFNFTVLANGLKGAPSSAAPTTEGQQPAAGSSGMSQIPPFLIKKLTIRIGTVQYFDFKSGDGKPQIYTFNYDQTFTNVTDFKEVAVSLMAAAMKQGMPFLAQAFEHFFGSLFDLNNLAGAVNDVLKLGGKVGGQLIDTGQSAVKGAGSLLNKLNPF